MAGSHSQIKLAEKALAVAAAATEAAADAGAETRRHHSTAACTPSGEFQAVLLSLVNELKVDSREQRQKIETVLVALATGDGRMGRIELQGSTTAARLGAIESRLAVVEQSGADTVSGLRNMDLRLQSIERGDSSGIQKAITTAVDRARKAADAPAAPKKDVGLSVSNSVMVKVLAVVGTIAAAVIGGYFSLRQTEVKAATAPAPATPAITPVKEP